MMKQLELSLFLDSFLENSIQKEIGYLKMSECVENLYLKPVLKKKHLESCQHSIDLKKCFLDSNITPSKKTYGTELKFDKWMNTNSILKITDKKRMLNEIILAEEKCIADYNLLLINKDLPLSLRTIINNQKKSVEKSLIELRNYSLLEGILF
tara:strand:- start:26 stop:484 length:459 start_codon:yes stop_codon:yes gene_type:complete